MKPAYAERKKLLCISYYTTLQILFLFTGSCPWKKDWPNILGKRCQRSYTQAYVSSWSP
jgi:hypothetical protein